MAYSPARVPNPKPYMLWCCIKMRGSGSSSAFIDRSLPPAIVGVMVEGNGTPPPKQEKESPKRTWPRGPRKRPPWWKRLWARTGFGDKTLWDLLQLLIVPLVLVGIGLLFEMQQAERQRALEEQQQALEEQRAQSEALLAYLDTMDSLLREASRSGNPADISINRELVRARTTATIALLNAENNRVLTRFLTDWNFTTQRGVGILHGADLRDADLAGAFFTDADLKDANLEGANLEGASLEGANLEGASLACANLRGAREVTNEELEQQAASLEGATMPNGQKYEEWHKSKSNGGNGENSNPANCS